MTAAPAAAETQAPAPDEAAALTARGLAHLTELADIGMTFARALGRVDVKSTAWAIAKDLGVDPGPDWWEDGWQITSPPPTRSGGGGGPPNGGGGGRPTAVSENASCSMPAPQIHETRHETG